MAQIGRRVDGSFIDSEDIPTQVDTNDAENIYLRWSYGREAEWVLRIHISSVITFYKGYGSWDDRASIKYDPLVGGN